MAKLIARIKIFPSEASSDIESIVTALRSTSGLVMKQSVKEPIAFGIFSIVADFVIGDAQGEMDRIEDLIKNIEGVGEIEVVLVSRQFVSLK